MKSDVADSASLVDAAPDRPASTTPTSAPSDDAATRQGFVDRSAGWIVGVAAVVAAAVLLYVGRRSSFFWDEWWFIIRRRDGTLDDFFRPWNGHLIAIPVAFYKAMFELVGLRAYLPYRLALTALHVGTCLLLFVYLRRRVTAVYAVAATVVVLFLGVGWEDLLWPFQVTFLASLAAGIGALLLLDRRDRAGDVGAMCALGVSLLSAGLGLIFMGGLIVELVWNRRDRRRLWVVGAPLALYLVWYALASEPSGKLEYFQYFDPFTTTMVGEAGRALFGAPLGLGQVLVVAFYVLAVVRAIQTWPVAGRFVNVLAMPIAFWALVTFSRGEFPVGSRYAHVGAIFLILAGAEVLRTWSAPRTLPRGVVVGGAIALVLVVGVSVAVNLGALRDGADDLREFSASDRTRFSALVHVADRADRRAVAFPTINPIRVGPTIDALTALEYPVLSPAEMLRQPEHARRTADGSMWEALGGSDTTAGQLADAGTTLAIQAPGSTVARDGACAAIVPSSPSSLATITADELKVRIEAGDAPVEVTARSLAQGFGPIDTWSIPPAATVAPRSTRDVTVQATDIRPWVLRLESGAPYRVCALR